MEIRLYRWRMSNLAFKGSPVLGILQISAAALSLLGIGFLLWFYISQNARIETAYADISGQLNADRPLTPAEISDLTHQACVLDSNIGSWESFFQPLSATLSGGGWCGNYVRVFVQFAGEAGYKAHKFHIHSDGRSHTLAEVYYQGKWRIIDPFFNQVYLLPDGQMATFEDLQQNSNLLMNPTQRPFNDPKLVKIYGTYAPILPALYRDADDFYWAPTPQALYHNIFVTLSYPFSIFDEGGRRPYLPVWLDRPELLGMYFFSFTFVVSVGPAGVVYFRDRRRNRVVQTVS